MARAPRKPVKTTEDVGAVTAPASETSPQSTPSEAQKAPTPIQRIDH